MSEKSIFPGHQIIEINPTIHLQPGDVLEFVLFDQGFLYGVGEDGQLVLISTQPNTKSETSPLIEPLLTPIFGSEQLQLMPIDPNFRFNGLRFNYHQLHLHRPI
jgi:hypothetical protein